jgi:ubiquinone/menaquinone biosynthesis C-methylase UbiE
MSEPTTYRARTNYDEHKATIYQHRKAHKHDGEMKLLDRAFSLIPKTHTVMDLPCGGGRVFLRLASHGYKVKAGDLSDAMIAIAQQNADKAGLGITVEKADVEHLTHPDRSIDTMVCFRLFQHFPTPAIRQRAVSELCRVSKQYVVLSYFSPFSWTQAKLILREKLGGRKLRKFPTSLNEVEGYFANSGFRLVKDFGQLPYIKSLHLAVFERISD